MSDAAAGGPERRRRLAGRRRGDVWSRRIAALAGLVTAATGGLAAVLAAGCPT